ncbi:hypothetical protein CMUS01_12296 [Colletotrichum musicola]|uniref:Uncharacterized protein n=1 Tax=Colletotrichum musicola TaxID=2175873 RepID=A0A8H6JPG1_9PEZI|nr:hypothetical protein CMUS01_12296 [Colletotrichum musicola]
MGERNHDPVVRGQARASSDEAVESPAVPRLDLEVFCSLRDRQEGRWLVPPIGYIRSCGRVTEARSSRETCETELRALDLPGEDQQRLD